MNRVKRSYDLVAGMYDALAKLFIGKALRKAQIYYLYLIPPNANVLVAGGGTGWILEEIAAMHPQHLCIDYVDVSAKMIALAQKRNAGKNKVRYINTSILNFTGSQPYDVILTPFLLDNFSENTMQKVFALLHTQLKQNGVWLYTDFQVAGKHSYWQKAVLFIMYSFFRIACNIEAERLPNVEAQFRAYRYGKIGCKTFLRRFIVTCAYKNESLNIVL